MKSLFEEYGNFVLIIIIGLLTLSIFFSNLMEMNRDDISKMLSYRERADYENND